MHLLGHGRVDVGIGSVYWKLNATYAIGTVCMLILIRTSYTLFGDSFQVDVQFIFCLLRSLTWRMGSGLLQAGAHSNFVTSDGISHSVLFDDVPFVRLQVLVVNLVALIWNTYLSYASHTSIMPAVDPITDAMAKDPLI